MTVISTVTKVGEMCFMVIPLMNLLKFTLKGKTKHLEQWNIGLLCLNVGHSTPILQIVE